MVVKLLLLLVIGLASFVCLIEHLLYLHFTFVHLLICKDQDI